MLNNLQAYSFDDVASSSLCRTETLVEADGLITTARL